MVEKKISGNGFKRQKLEKTRDRRARLGSERRLAAARETGRRNDLLPSLQLVTVRVCDLKPSEHRTRVTPSEQLERVSLSISTLGFNQPILIVGSEILDGHTRVEAAKRLGLEKIPAIDCSHLTPTEVRELRLAVIGLVCRSNSDRFVKIIRIIIVHIIGDKPLSPRQPMNCAWTCANSSAVTFAPRATNAA